MKDEKLTPNTINKINTTKVGVMGKKVPVALILNQVAKWKEEDFSDTDDGPVTLETVFSHLGYELYAEGLLNLRGIENGKKS